MDPQTPDAGMIESWAEQSSLGKRGRNGESPEEKSSAAATGAPEICDNKKAALECAIDPKHLGKLTERVPVLPTEAGEPDKYPTRAWRSLGPLPSSLPGQLQGQWPS